MSKNLTVRVNIKTYELIQHTAAKAKLSIIDLSTIIFQAGLEIALKRPLPSVDQAILLQENKEPSNEA